jgi:hypothetical protein
MAAPQVAVTSTTHSSEGACESSFLLYDLGRAGMTLFGFTHQDPEAQRSQVNCPSHTQLGLTLKFVFSPIQNFLSCDNLVPITTPR